MSTRASNISENVILDPSLLLVERTLSKLEYNLAELSNIFSFYISRHFYDILQEEKSESLTIDYFRYTSELVDVDRLKTFLEENRKYIQKFEMPEGAPSEYGRMYESVFRSLSAKYRYEENLRNIIFEEWFFLKEYSWLVARTKRIFNLFIRSGAASLEFGSRIFDTVRARAQRHTDTLVRRTTRSQQDQLITNADRLRAIAKWVAVAGAATSNVFDPRIQVLADLATGGFFLLIDP